MELKAPNRLKNQDYFQQIATPIRLFLNTIDGHLDVHWHEFFELGFVIDGEGEQHLNGQYLPMRKGSLFLLTPADFHELSAHTSKCLHYNLIFSGEALQEGLYALLLNGNRNMHCMLSGNAYLMVESEFIRIMDEFADIHVGSEFIIQGALERILIELVRQTIPKEHIESIQDVHRTNEDVIRRILAYLQMNFRDDLKLETVAEFANLSSNYFSQCFRRYTGVTYQNYLLDLRLQFASSLLKVSTLPITEICHASGFNTLPHFERTFKKKFIVSPRAYRKAQRPNE